MHVMKLLSLEGKRALITGGEGRYGSCITEGLAEAGAAVVTASPFLDAGEAFAAGLRDDLAAEFGGIDIFVNNAVARVCKGYNEASIEEFHESMRINATGMFDITR